MDNEIFIVGEKMMMGLNVGNFFKHHHRMGVQKNLIVVNDTLYVVCERLGHLENK